MNKNLKTKAPSKVFTYVKLHKFRSLLSCSLPLFPGFVIGSAIYRLTSGQFVDITLFFLFMGLNFLALVVWIGLSIFLKAKEKHLDSETIKSIRDS